MLFKDWLKAQYKSGRLDKEEVEKAVDELRLREKVTKRSIYSKSRWAKECYRNEEDNNNL